MTSEAVDASALLKTGMTGSEGVERVGVFVKDGDGDANTLGFDEDGDAKTLGPLTAEKGDFVDAYAINPLCVIDQHKRRRIGWEQLPLFVGTFSQFLVEAMGAW